MRQPINQSGLSMASFFFPQKYILGNATYPSIVRFAVENCPFCLAFIKRLCGQIFYFYIGWYVNFYILLLRDFMFLLVLTYIVIKE
jgi:hypothetical protein